MKTSLESGSQALSQAWWYAVQDLNPFPLACKESLQKGGGRLPPFVINSKMTSEFFQI